MAISFWITSHGSGHESVGEARIVLKVEMSRRKVYEAIVNFRLAVKRIDVCSAEM